MISEEFIAIGSVTASAPGAIDMLLLPEKVKCWRVVRSIMLEPVRFWLSKLVGRAKVIDVTGKFTVPKLFDKRTRI